MRRFSETRRPHPYRHLALAEAVRPGARRAGGRAGAGRRDPRHHRARRPTSCEPRSPRASARPSWRCPMVVRCESFGFRYGLPPDANLVFDVRFLPNPHFVPELRPLPGDHPEVTAWLERAARGGGDVRADSRPVRGSAAGLQARAEELPGGRVRLHGRQAPVGLLRRAPGEATCRARAGWSRSTTAIATARAEGHRREADAQLAGELRPLAAGACRAWNNPRMVGVLVISHGRLATELLAAARTIEPALAEQSRAITLEWNLDPEAARGGDRPGAQGARHRRRRHRAHRHVRRHADQPLARVPRPGALGGGHRASTCRC